MIESAEHRACVAEALERLDVRELVFGIHDAAFPSSPESDTGRGSPYGPAGTRLVQLVRDLGFSAIQLGPQGETSEINPSPYDGTLFSREPLSISLDRLAEEPWDRLISSSELGQLVDKRPTGGEQRVPHPHVYRAHRELLGRAFQRFRSKRAGAGAQRPVWKERFEAFQSENATWLERDALYRAACLEHPHSHWRHWDGDETNRLDRRLCSVRAGQAARAARIASLQRRYADAIEFVRFCQFVSHEQHAAFRRRVAEAGLVLYGDLQAGISEQDAWAYPDLLLPGYCMGAPPSRTNPEGQPWDYPVLDPRQYADGQIPGPALRFIAARLDKALDEFDRLRIDHPHGLVDPWVYRMNGTSPWLAIQHGARLLSSPDLEDHPELSRFAVARSEQLNPRPGVPRHADDWVVELEPDQVDRYARVFDEVLASLRRHGRDARDLACEVLSTLPYPLQRVLERHGLGRFRVTQKASATDPTDVYRSENANPEDWILIGNHDTAPIWALVQRWESAERESRARYLAERLVAAPAARGAFARRLMRQPELLVHAQFANLFASRAQHVLIYFTDVFGFEEPYNRPGTINPHNWSLRLPGNFEALYAQRVARGRALNLPRALGLALSARDPLPAEVAALCRRLEELASVWDARPASS